LTKFDRRGKEGLGKRILGKEGLGSSCKPKNCGRATPNHEETSAGTLKGGAHTDSDDSIETQLFRKQKLRRCLNMVTQADSAIRNKYLYLTYL
jgi:hypothetical protein